VPTGTYTKDFLKHPHKLSLVHGFMREDGQEPPPILAVPNPTCRPPTPSLYRSLPDFRNQDRFPSAYAVLTPCEDRRDRGLPKTSLIAHTKRHYHESDCVIIGGYHFYLMLYLYYCHKLLR
jgi:hypothetical protein